MQLFIDVTGFTDTCHSADLSTKHTSTNNSVIALFDSAFNIFIICNIRLRWTTSANPSCSAV